MKGIRRRLIRYVDAGVLAVVSIGQFTLSSSDACNNRLRKAISSSSLTRNFNGNMLVMDDLPRCCFSNIAYDNIAILVSIIAAPDGTSAARPKMLAPRLIFEISPK